VFLARIERKRLFAPEDHGFLFDCISRSSVTREDIQVKHLQVELPVTLCADWWSVPNQATFGVELVWLLPQALGMFLNLRSLTIVMQHGASTGASSMMIFNGHDLKPREAYITEIKLSLVFGLLTASAYRSPSLKEYVLQA